MDGLFRRGGMWWARLVVPARLRDLAGRREFVQCWRHECPLLFVKSLGHAVLIAIVKADGTYKGSQALVETDTG